MSDLLPAQPGDDPRAGDATRMAALSLLLHQVMKRPHHRRLGTAAAARERVGADLGALFDGIFGGAAPEEGGQAGAGGLGGLIAGMGSLIESLREQGLGRQVDSWISNGPNAPVTPAEIAPVFDPEEIESMARKAGTDRESLLRELSLLLPEFVHRMTPQGSLPQHEGEVPGGLGGLLGGLLGNGGGSGGGSLSGDAPEAGRGARGGAAARLYGGAGEAGASAEHATGRGASLGGPAVPRFSDEPPGREGDAASGYGGPPLPRGAGDGTGHG